MLTLLVILILLIVVALILRHLLRTFFYPRPPHSMPDVVDADLDSALRRFESALGQHAPDVLAALQPGLSHEQICEIEAKYRLWLSDDMRTLYLWRNGSVQADRVELIPGHSFISLEDAAELRYGLRQQLSTQPLMQRLAYWVLAGHRTTWLTVLDDLCGDGYFYDPSRGRTSGSFFYHFAQDRQYRFFPSLSNFLAGASECYERGIYRKGQRDSTAEVFERSHEIWAKYSAWPGA
jgi:cell wall assembly regulator SMI1